MITVTYRPDRHRLDIKGHADFAEKGQDIICAATSMVFYNLCQMLREYESKAFAHQPKMQYTSGKASVEVIPASGYETWIDHDFLYALTGFRLLMARYPDYVNLKITKK